MFTYQSEERTTPYSSVRSFTIYNECITCEDFIKEEITILYNIEINQKGQEIYFFAIKN